jgi:serine/threonine protein phosphatase PrpC
MKELFGKKGRSRMKRYICEGIVKGATHVRNQMPCQDNKKIIKISDEITIIALADGHGSSKCPRSDRGSMIAVNSFYHIMKKYLEIYGEDEEDITHLMTFLNREGDVRFAQDVCEEWQARVKQSFYKNKVEGMTNEDGSIKWPSVFSLYGTTLLGMLITDSFVFSFQIGDGDISAVTKNVVEPLVEPEKFLGTETHSLSKPDAWRKAVTSVHRLEAESRESYMYILSTDGFANSYTSDKEYQKTCRDYLQMIRKYGIDVVQKNLKKWLTETSELGCGDDITVVMVYFSKE